MISLLLRVYLLGSDIKPEMAEMHPEPCFMNLLCLLHFFSWKCNCFGITGIMGRNHTIKRVSYRVGKYDEVNLSLTEILWVFNFFFFLIYNFLVTASKFAKPEEIFLSIFYCCCCCCCSAYTQKGRPGLLPEAIVFWNNMHLKILNNPIITQT